MRVSSGSAGKEAQISLVIPVDCSENLMPVYRINGYCNIPGPSCSKLTMSLVNDSLKFTSSDMQIC